MGGKKMCYGEKEGRFGAREDGSGCYLDSRQHDSDQVVVWEQQGAHHAAVTDVLDDGCGGGSKRR